MHGEKTDCTLFLSFDNSLPCPSLPLFPRRRPLNSSSMNSRVVCAAFTFSVVCLILIVAVLVAGRELAFDSVEDQGGLPHPHAISSAVLGTTGELKTDPPLLHIETQSY